MIPFDEHLNGWNHQLVEVRALVDWNVSTFYEMKNHSQMLHVWNIYLHLTIGLSQIT